jgi:hypothetical protein
MLYGRMPEKNLFSSTFVPLKSCRHDSADAGHTATRGSSSNYTNGR